LSGGPTSSKKGKQRRLRPEKPAIGFPPKLRGEERKKLTAAHQNKRPPPQPKRRPPKITPPGVERGWWRNPKTRQRVKTRKGSQKLWDWGTGIYLKKGWEKIMMSKRIENLPEET